MGNDYFYATEGWKDQLVSFNGEQCVYDEIGNPTTYRNHNLSLTKVRRLASFDNHTFEYNASGIRTKKNNITYTLDGNKLLKQTEGRNVLTFHYGLNGIVGCRYGDTDYYYHKNLQGDVYEIYSVDALSEYRCVAKYVYDAWGNILAITDGDGEDKSSDISHIAYINPIRYRSYYYDRETNLYYLESRYYDPETGRFLNADSIDYLDPETIQGANLYAYCINNPVMHLDACGTFWFGLILGAVVGLVTGLVDYAQKRANEEDLDWKDGFQIGLSVVVGAVTGVVGPVAAALISGVGSGINSMLSGNTGTEVLGDVAIGMTISALASGSQLVAGRVKAGSFVKSASKSQLKKFANKLGHAGKNYKNSSSWKGKIMYDASTSFMNAPSSKITGASTTLVLEETLNIVEG